MLTSAMYFSYVSLTRALSDDVDIDIARTGTNQGKRKRGKEQRRK